MYMHFGLCKAAKYTKGILAFNRSLLKPLLLRNFTAGFTLAELLVALSILGIIVTFSIPKILGSQSEKQKIAI